VEEAGRKQKGHSKVTESRYSFVRIEPYTVETCSSLKEQAERDPLRYSNSIGLPRRKRICAVSGREECCRVLQIGRRVEGGGLFVVAAHVTKEEAERMREERLAIVCREVCAGCGQAFDGRKVPEGHPIGYYGQYCCGACRDRKEQEMKDLAQQHSTPGQVVLIIDANDRYCYLVTNNGPRDPEHRHYHYGFKLLTEAREAPGEKLSLDYCFLDRTGVSLTAHRIYPLVRFALARIDSYANSMWAIMGVTLEEGVALTFGVGSVPIIIDQRLPQAEPRNTLPLATAHEKGA
jgi:hypothetical protein